MDFTDSLREVAILVLIFLISIAVFFIYKRGTTIRRSILLTGLSDSGKTLIFSRVVHKTYIQTFTSMKENIGGLFQNNNYLKIVDIPGHERVRYKFFDEYKSSAKGIVFVVDSSTLQADVKNAAEYLYNILSDDVLAKNKTNVLILCNKQDQSLAKGSNAIKSIFEKELNTLRITKSRQVESVDPKSSNKSVLGDQDKEFTFNDFVLNIEFAECYANNSQDGSHDIEQLSQWLVKMN